MSSQSKSFPTRRQAIARCVLTAAVPLVCAAVLTAAVLTPAPPVVLPVIIALCIGYPMLIAVELPAVLAALGATGSAPPVRRTVTKLHDHEVGALLRELEQLPETHHPLGL